ncbi:MAG: hypothetical protein MOB07_26465 [Acidobacteria bacterium]|nr:hypothetical protein [Acidobacteriota bacterium]
MTLTLVSAPLAWPMEASYDDRQFRRALAVFVADRRDCDAGIQALGNNLRARHARARRIGHPAQNYGA